MPDRSPSAPRARGGRPRDAGRDAAIVAAALDVLAEHGYERMTMDQVARRAGAGKATLYRRWPSKADLVVHAVSQFGRTPTLEELPDTGTLRGDLLALLRPQSPEDDRQALAVASGIASLLSAEPALADAAGAALVEPFVASQRLLLRRAVERGEVAGDVDVDTIAFVTPSMTAFRLIVQRRTVDVAHLARLVDTVVLPALGLTPSPDRTSPTGHPAPENHPVHHRSDRGTPMTTLEAMHDLAPAGDRGNATRTIGAALRRALVVAPESTAVVCGEVTLTYRELAGRVRRLLDVLAGFGLAPGDRVAVLSANSHRYVELYLALPIAGYVIVPLNFRHTEAERRYALADSGAAVLLTDRDAGGDDDLRVVDLAGEYEELLAGAEERPWDDRSAEHDLAGIFYTGGTTGAAKGVMLTHGNLVANAFHFMACWPFTAGTRFMVVAPMFHAAGTIGALATVWAGGAQVIVPAFTAADVLDVVERERVTATLVVPTMLDALAGEQTANPRDVSSLRWLSHGSSPAAVELLRRTHAAFPDASMLHIYGLTETSPIVTLHPDEQDHLDADRATSCGRPAIGVEIVVADPVEGSALGAGEVGEVYIRGANVTPGYWNKPEETGKAVRDGWFTSGDLGYLDEQGFLFLVDRAKDMIVTGGENVYSAEVENALYSHPAVVEAAVFGIPDERWGEAVHAVVTVRSATDQDELIAHCRTTIAGYKTPKSVELRDEPLPKSGAGKILKRQLRDEHRR